MIKQVVQKALRSLGYELRRLEPSPQTDTGRAPAGPIAEPPPVNPTWPLPRRSGGPSDEEIRTGFARYDLWHYAYAFDGGLTFQARNNDPNLVLDTPERPLQRFGHFMPYLIEAENGSLRGKRVLDIGCNSGFWSIQLALLGAEVVGVDARPELIEQANLVKSIVGATGAEFRVLDFWDMSPRTLDGIFDVVLNLGILYHLPNPLEALRLTKSLARRTVLLDTRVYRSMAPLVKLVWKEPTDIRAAAVPGLVAYPSKSSIDLMLRHIGVTRWFEIPIRTTEMPLDYLDGSRASWLIMV